MLTSFIMILQITLNFSFTLKKCRNHTEKIFTKETTLIITLKCSLCCSKTLKSHWTIFSVTYFFSPRINSITLDFQCDFQCHNFIESLNWSKPLISRKNSEVAINVVSHCYQDSLNKKHNTETSIWWEFVCQIWCLHMSWHIKLKQALFGIL